MSVLGDAPALEVQPQSADQGAQSGQAPNQKTRSDRGAGARSKPAGGGRRNEIQGLRAVAVLLVAAYHIWLGRVSGGVDVFLMLTGFLITGSLLRGVERTGKVGFLAFAGRIIRRLFPPAAIVLLGVLGGMLLWLPRGVWRDTFGGIFAAALYYENWHLALNSVDYLAGSGTASPVQHFWSLAIQGQFYLIWPVLLAVATFLALLIKKTPRAMFLGVLVLVFGASLAYSVYKTAAEQQWAYFDTGARLWELALGGIAAIVLPLVKVPRPIRIVLGWLGLAGLVSCGLLLQVSTMFPGYIALWPTGSALLVLIAGSTDSRLGADRLLSTTPLKYLGDISYSLYLWHWPILIFYITTSGKNKVDFIGGAGILGVSFLLAVVTTSVSDRAVDLVTARRHIKTWSFALGMACVLPVVAVTGGWSYELDKKSGEDRRLVANASMYPGAQALVNRKVQYPVMPVLPDPADAAKDLPETYTNGCGQDTIKSDVIVCTYGSKRPVKTIALIGNSHAAHWFPALNAIAERNSWRILVMTKGACMLSDELQTYKGKAYPSCDIWQQGVLSELAKRKPDIVMTNATHSSPEGEVLTEGMITRWKQLNALGIRVLAYRDIPRLKFKAPECVETKGRDACQEKKTYSLADKSPILALGKRPQNVWFTDFTPYICRGGSCPAVIGNVLVYWDQHGHFTATFARTLGPLLEQQLKKAFLITKVPARRR